MMDDAPCVPGEVYELTDPHLQQQLIDNPDTWRSRPKRPRELRTSLSAALEVDGRGFGWELSVVSREPS